MQEKNVTFNEFHPLEGDISTLSWMSKDFIHRRKMIPREVHGSPSKETKVIIHTGAFWEEKWGILIITLK